MKKNFNLLAFIIGLAVLGALIWSVSSFRPTLDNNNEDRLTVSASFYPLYFLAERLGGERVNVNLIIPAGVDPHDYELTARDLVNLNKSHLILVSGGGLEPWADNLARNLDEASSQILFLGPEFMTLDFEHDGELESDPHIWLDPQIFSSLAERTAWALMSLDPEGDNYYQDRLSALQEELALLDRDFKQGLADCSGRDFIVTHAAFAYLAAAYDLKQLAISGLSHKAEPSPRALATLADLARSKNIGYVFFEDMVSPALAETLAREIGAQTLVLSPVEALAPDDLAAGEDYFSRMRDNLSNLQLALGCR